MDELRQYAVPYLISNILGMFCIWGALKRPGLTRLFLACVFFWASFVNTKTALQHPEAYLDYARLTHLSFYRDFIEGYFANHVPQFVLPIAISQCLICSGLLAGRIWTNLACIGGMVFGLAIAPLGIGAAFPATVLMALSFFILLVKYAHGPVWKFRTGFSKLNKSYGESVGRNRRQGAGAQKKD